MAMPKTLRQAFRVIAQDGLALSANPATTGGHATLDHIHGRRFLGLAARDYAAYGSLAWAVFHGGAVRFGAGYPLTPQDEPGIPVPLSWYEAPRAHRRAISGGRVNANGCRDLSRANRADPFASGQVPLERVTGYVTRSGAHLAPRTSFRGQSAKDRAAGGRAREGMVHGLASIDATQRFWFVLSVPAAPAGQALLERLTASLTRRPSLGRSRHSEYGTVAIEPWQDFPDPLDEPAPLEGSDCLRFYLLSETALLDPTTGTATATPPAAAVGLPPSWSLDPARSFMAQRSYAPFNQKRRAFDRPRHVLAAGSVLTFQGAALDRAQAQTLRDVLAGGLGLFTQEGLGEVRIEPWCVRSEQPGFTPRQPVSGAAAPDPPLPADPLGRMVAARERAEALRLRLDRLARKHTPAAPDRTRPVAASPVVASPVAASQWAALAELAAATTSPEELQALLDDPKTGLLTSGVAAQRWAAERTRIQAILEEGEADGFADRRDLLVTVAWRMRSLVRRS